MRIHTIHYSEVIDLGDGPEEGDVVDIAYQCGYHCMVAEMDRATEVADWDVGPGAGTFIHGDTALSFGGCPGGAETDYDVYCSFCEVHLWHGLQCFDSDGEPVEGECGSPDEGLKVL